MKKILVTGASGFLGRAIVERLLNEGKWAIYALASGKHPVDFPVGVKKIYCDLLNPLERKDIINSVKPEIILHLAWDLGNEHFLESVSNIAWLEASLHLLRLFKESGGKYFLFAGSSAEYGVEYNSTAGIESSPISLYGRCKLAFTNIALSMMGGGGGYAILRYFSMYGEYDDRPKRAIPWAIQSFLRHKPVVCEFPKNIWDYMYIKDAADATVQVLNAEYYGIINIASGISRQMKDIFLEIAHIMGSEEYLSFNDNNACKSTLVADTSILNKQIGYVCQTNFCDGLETTIGWWKKNMKDYSFS